MHRTKILLIVIVLLCTMCVAKGEEKKLGVTLDLIYRSNMWITKGSEGYGSDPAFFKTIDLDLWGSGFGAAVTHQEATKSGWVDKERLILQRHLRFENATAYNR